MVISVTGFTAARSQAIEDEAIIGGEVNGAGDLILSKFNGATINAGSVIGPQGVPGSGLIICTSATRPAGPSEGTMIWETDTNRIYVFGGTNWRWVHSVNGENKVRVGVEVGGDVDAISFGTYPPSLEQSVNIPPWAKNLEAFALLGQVQQVTDTSNTELRILIGSRVVTHKRIRLQVTGGTAERDIILMGDVDVSDLAGSTQLFRVTGERLSGTGALRLDSESVCYLTGEFTDE